MVEIHQSWWEKFKPVAIFQAALHPKAVVRQIEVACDMAQAPPGSDQETFSRIFPAKAASLLKKGETKHG